MKHQGFFFISWICSTLCLLYLGSHLLENIARKDNSLEAKKIVRVLTTRCRKSVVRRLFPGYLVPLFQNESVQKLSCENEFDLRENEPQVGTLFYYCFRTTWKWPTSFPGPLFFPPPGAPRGGRKRDPGTEVGKWPKLLRLATYHTLLTCPLCILV